MKKIITALIFILSVFTTFTQTENNPISNNSLDNEIVYRLFPTENIWTFIKLNTRNGKMWQVQFSLERNQLKVPLSLVSLVFNADEVNGRFFLYPTQNMYNFLLLDQINGRVWQVQWSTNPDRRFVIPIY